MKISKKYFRKIYKKKNNIIIKNISNSEILDVYEEQLTNYHYFFIWSTV